MYHSTYSRSFRVTGLIILFFFLSKPIFAHAGIVDIEKMNAKDAAILYVQLGYKHILPLGLDHILFVLSLFLLNPRLKSILWQATTFTVAHTITLGLSMYQILPTATNWVEPLIALSIIYVALENIFSTKLKPYRIGIIFLFGLIHGMGFAGALGNIGLPPNAYMVSLLMFNLGVELGQITVILIAWFLLAKWFGNKIYYRKLIVIPLSVLISLIASYWLFERISF